MFHVELYTAYNTILTNNLRKNLQSGNATTSRIQQHVIPGSSTGNNSGAQRFPTETKDLHVTDIDNYPYHR